MARLNFLLSVEQRYDARRAFAILEGSGLTLEQAAIRALHGRRAAVHVKTADAIERFQLSRVRKMTRRGKFLRPATISFYEEKLAPLLKSQFADQPFDAIGRTEFRKWISGLDTGAAMRAGIARACRALWLWAMNEDPPLTTEDVTVGSVFAAPLGSDMDRMVLSLDQIKAIFKAATWQKNAIAMMLFSGVRPEEVVGEEKPAMLWAHVNVKEKWIRVTDEIAKTAKPRLIEGIPPTLWRWLTPGEPTEAISPHSSRSIREFAREVTGMKEWPHDCFRHTAATYLLSAVQDAGKVAEWLGWEGRPALLHQTYRGRLTTKHEPMNRAMAKEFIALRP